MAGASASQRRATRGDISLFPAETALGWRVIGTVTPAKASAKLARGEWREVYDEYGNFLGCQIIATHKSDRELPSGASSISISAREMEMNAGLRGNSRTIGMPEGDRISRRNSNGKALPPEDAVERAQAKVAEWPLAHGDRAVRVYPKQA